jgi:hypothetical protein
MAICALPPAVVAAAIIAFAPPSGRPPTGPLERYEPRVYDLGFDVVLSMVSDSPPYAPRPGTGSFNLADAPIVFPIIFQSAYSEVDRASMKAQLWLDGREDASLTSRLRLDEGQPFHAHLAVMPINEFRGQTLRWQIMYRAQVFSSRLNEAGAAKLTWPREWPEEVQDGLKPQFMIESGDPLFAKAVEQVTKGKLRTVPPYYAAKELVRYCIENFQVTGSANRRGNLGVLRWMVVEGASKAAAAGRGTSHDLVCVCVATLRAAGIPARPVIGVQEREQGGNEFVTWAEFYLQGAGWIPFDPEVMRGKGIRQLKVQDAWPEFGTMEDLNRRIPLAFTFVPPSSKAPGGPAVWGWDPSPGGDPGAQPSVMLTTVSRGRGTEDPR